MDHVKALANAAGIVTPLLVHHLHPFVSVHTGGGLYEQRVAFHRYHRLCPFVQSHLHGLPALWPKEQGPASATQPVRERHR